jgi:hypothetical protein
MIDTLMNDVGLSCVVFLIITLLLKFALILADDNPVRHYTAGQIGVLLVFLVVLALSELFMVVLLMLQLNLIVVATIVLCIKFLNYKVK